MFHAQLNACGDFTLLSREDWFALRGYAEFEMYSFHIDSLFCLAAVASGVKEVVWPDEVFHIEHGGGWAPEPAKNAGLRSDLKKRKVPILTEEQLRGWHREMHAARKAKIFNGASWGLADEALPETVFARAAQEIAAR